MSPKTTRDRKGQIVTIWTHAQLNFFTTAHLTRLLHIFRLTSLHFLFTTTQCTICVQLLAIANPATGVRMLMRTDSVENLEHGVESIDLLCQ